MKNLILFTLLLFALVSCNNEKKSSTQATLSNTKTAEQQEEAYTLFKNTCYACHSITSKSHDEIIAPPMIAVKKRYLMANPQKEDFVNAIVNFSKEPTEQKALMFGAVQQFKVMTNLNYKEEDLKKIATYIYENDIEKPVWFDAHFNEQRGGRMGAGRQGNNN